MSSGQIKSSSLRDRFADAIDPSRFNEAVEELGRRFARGAAGEASQKAPGIASEMGRASGSEAGKAVVDELLNKVLPRLGPTAKHMSEQAIEGASNAIRSSARSIGAQSAIGAGVGALSSDENEHVTGAIRGALGGAVMGPLVGAMGSGSFRTPLRGLGSVLGGAAGGYTTKEGESLMSSAKSKYAGVVLDWYDDGGETLKQKFPTVKQLPGLIKRASIRPKESLSDDDFALVMVDSGIPFCKYACHDPGTTAMSVIYFLENKDKLPAEAQKIASENLIRSVEKFGKEKIASAIKEAVNPHLVASGLGALGAQLNTVAKFTDCNADGSTKTAFVDVTGKGPAPIIKTARPDDPNDYALISDDGTRRFPIHTWELVKTAEGYFRENKVRFHAPARRQFAVKLASKAESMGYPIDPDIRRLGSTTYADSGRMRSAIDMRKLGFAKSSVESAFLNELFEKRAELEPEVYAECLRRFDLQEGLNRQWNTNIPDPWDSTFGIKTAAVVWEDGADRVTDEELQNLSLNHSELNQTTFTGNMIREFQKNPVDVFQSLPTPQKRMVARLAFDCAHSGESEGGPLEMRDKVAGLGTALKKGYSYGRPLMSQAEEAKMMKDLTMQAASAGPSVAKKPGSAVMDLFKNNP
jgi:hypothetical protein